MQKLKNVIKGHRHGAGAADAEYEAHGATAYDEGVAGAGGVAPVSGVGGVSGVGAAGVAGKAVQERPVGVGVAEVPVVVTEQERVATGATGGAAGRAGEEVCGVKTFTEVEDRPVLKERVERIVEHQPVEKQYVVETRFTGERPIAGGGGASVVDVKERVVEAAEPGPKCPVNAGAMMNEAVAGTGLAGSGVAPGHHHHHGQDRI